MANPRVTPGSETFEAIHDEAWNVQVESLLSGYHVLVPN